MEEQHLYRISLDEREIILLGTAHISSESVQQVEETIESERPDQVCVELDAGRLNALTNPNRWKNLDLKTIIRQGQLSTLLANLLLASYQKRMGAQTGVKPGAELLAAVTKANTLQLEVLLVDREVKTTLRRAWGFTPFKRKILLISSLVASLFDKSKVDEEQLREIRKKDTLGAMMDELGNTFPEIRETVIHERDHYLAGRILEAKGPKVLAVVGAGHVPGIIDIIENRKQPREKAELDTIPKASSIWRNLLWIIPVLFIASMVWIAMQQGFSAMGDNLLRWFLVTGGFGAFGAALALPHPLVVLVAFVMTPLKPFRPFVGLGVFTSLTQAYMAPPRVEEMESVTDDISKPKKWYSNRLLRIALVFLTPAPFTWLGYGIAARQIWLNLQG